MANQKPKPLKDITGKDILSDADLDQVAGGMMMAGARCKCKKDNSGTKDGQIAEETSCG